MTLLVGADRLDRVSLNVGDLDTATAFYCNAVGFTAAAPRDADPALAGLLGARTIRLVQLQRGRQTLELAAFDPPGQPYPSASRSNDIWFQHCALVTDDIAAAHARLGRFRFTPISPHGPVALPGGIVAFKFRDADGHPLELIQFPRPDPRTRDGIDHAAISVADAQRSIAFYATRLGLATEAVQLNTGPAQDALDGLGGVAVDVIALTPPDPAPHLELLAYRTPAGRASPTMRAADVAASRLVFTTRALTGDAAALRLTDGSLVRLLHDPDGHAVLLEQYR